VVVAVAETTLEFVVAVDALDLEAELAGEDLDSNEVAEALYYLIAIIQKITISLTCHVI
jgi:hypothetical protein